MIRAVVERARQSRKMVLGGQRRFVARMSLACARGAVAVAARHVDPLDTRTWEFSSFSQNGEDGIIDELLRRVGEPTRYFLEVGASDGLENNSSYLAFVRRYSGLMVEGDPQLSQEAARQLQTSNVGVDYLSMLVEPENAAELVERCLVRTPDFFSLDIDGNDYHVTSALLEQGLRPKVVCVEYNSAFGPNRAVTIPYTRGFDYHYAHPTQLYYGVSVRGWRALFEGHGYHFVTVDSNGVNAFFTDPSQVDVDVSRLHRLEWRENFAQLGRFRSGWTGQFALISQLPLVEVSFGEAWPRTAAD